MICGIDFPCHQCSHHCPLLDGIASLSSFHNGSKSRDSVPLWCRVSRSTTATGLLDGIASPSSFHNGSKSCDSVPLRCSVGAVAVPRFPQNHCYVLSGRDCLSILFPQRQQIPRFGAVVVPRLDGIASLSSFHNGSKSRDSVPLWCRVSRSTTATGLLDGIASPSSFHNGSKSCDSVPLWCHIPAHPCTCPCHRLTHLPKVRRISRIFRHLPNVGNTWIFSGG